MRISVLDDNGVQRFVDLDEVKQALGIGGPLFFDDFSVLSVEDGQEPGTGATWCDSFPKINGNFGVRELEANGDIYTKKFDKEWTHHIGPEGLALRVSTALDGGYVAGCIYAVRSFSALYGRFTMRMRLNRISAGQHLSWWMLAADGSHPPEFDFEWIGSNSHAPNGPINSLFLNDHSNPDSFEWQNYPEGFFADWHDYTFDWQKDTLRWLLDGEEIKRVPNRVNKPMSILVTWEGVEEAIGKNEDGNFPGVMNESTVFPAEAQIAWIKVEK